MRSSRPERQPPVLGVARWTSTARPYLYEGQRCAIFAQEFPTRAELSFITPRDALASILSVAEWENVLESRGSWRPPPGLRTRTASHQDAAIAELPPRCSHSGRGCRSGGSRRPTFAASVPKDTADLVPGARRLRAGRDATPALTTPPSRSRRKRREPPIAPPTKHSRWPTTAARAFLVQAGRIRSS